MNTPRPITTRQPQRQGPKRSFQLREAQMREAKDEIAHYRRHGERQGVTA